MDDMLTRIAHDLVARVSGPMKFRLVLQPCMAAFFAIRSGLADAKAGRPPYFWTILSDPDERAALLKDGWRSVGKVFVLAIVLDVVYQVIVERFIYPGEAIIVAFILAILPYLVLRGLTTRLARGKKSIGIGASIGGLAVLLLLAGSFLIPVDSFRSTIEEQASAALGRPVALGTLRLSLWSRSLHADTVTVADDPAFGASPFLAARSITVGVKLLPLIMSHSLNVRSITLEQPTVTLTRNAAGRWNYASLGSTAARPGGSGGSAAFAIEKFELKDGRLVVGSPAVKRTYDHVDVTAADVSSMATSAIIATAALPGGGTFSLVGDLGPVDRSDAGLTTFNASVAVDGLNLATTGFVDSSAGLGGVLDLKGTITSVRGQARVVGSAMIAKALLVSGGSPAPQPALVEFNASYDLWTHAGTLNPSTLKIAGATAQLDGTFDGRGDRTVVNIRVAGARMPAREVESFLPALGIHLPQGAHLATGTFVTNLNVAGPIGRLVATGTAGVFDARLTGFNLGSKMRAISAFTGLNTGGDLDINELTSNVRIAADGLRFDHVNGVVPPLGHLTGAGTIDARNNLDFMMVAALANSSSGGNAGGGAAAVGTSGILNDVLSGLTGGQANRLPSPRAPATPSSYLRGGRIPFRIQGPTSNPQFVPDVGGVVTQTLKEQFKEQLGR